MSYEPLMDGKALTNVATEHVFKTRVTFGSAAVASYRAKDIVFARTGTGVYTVTFPKPYLEVTDFHVGQFGATGTSGLQWMITTNAIATTGILTLTAVDTNSAGTATEPATGTVAYITIGVSCDTANSKYVG